MSRNHLWDVSNHVRIALTFALKQQMLIFRSGDGVPCNQMQQGGWRQLDLTRTRRHVAHHDHLTGTSRAQDVRDSGTPLTLVSERMGISDQLGESDAAPDLFDGN